MGGVSFVAENELQKSQKKIRNEVLYLFLCNFVAIVGEGT